MVPWTLGVSASDPGRRRQHALLAATPTVGETVSSTTPPLPTAEVSDCLGYSPKMALTKMRVRGVFPHARTRELPILTLVWLNWRFVNSVYLRCILPLKYTKILCFLRKSENTARWQENRKQNYVHFLKNLHYARSACVASTFKIYNLGFKIYNILPSLPLR